MGKKIPFALPSMSFEAKKDAKAFFRLMLHSYSDGQSVNQVDSQLLLELLQFHSQSQQKIGSGVARFYKDISPDPRTSCFWIERIDGSKIDFSVYDCI